MIFLLCDRGWLKTAIDPLRRIACANIGVKQTIFVLNAHVLRLTDRSRADEVKAVFLVNIVFAF